MSDLRRIWMWVSLAAIAALIVLSVIGAFMGAEAAGRMFNSWPLGGGWLALAALLVGGLVLYPSLIRRGGPLAMHLGVLAILAGGMWGSQASHDLRRRIRKPGKVRSGYMFLDKGVSDRRIVAADGRTQLGRLDFDVLLEDFRVEYYGSPDPPYLVSAVARPDGQRLSERIDWQGAAPAQVPFTEAKLRMLQFFPAARVWSDHRLQVRIADQIRTLPIAVGAELAMTEGKGKIRIVRIFENLTLVPGEGGIQAVDLPEEGSCPAVEVKLESAGGLSETRFVYADSALAETESNSPLIMQYVIVPAAEPDAKSATAACKVELSAGGRSLRGWLILPADQPRAQLPLAELYNSVAQWRKSGKPTVVFLRREGPVRDWIARLAIHRDGQVLARKDVEVNQPLHYGGYHFYQSGWDGDKGDYTMLTVTSDDGLLMVYVGFVLLTGGAAWTFYLRPVWRRRAGGKP